MNHIKNHVKNRGSVSLLGLFVIIAIVLLGTSVYFYKKNDSRMSSDLNGILNDPNVGNATSSGSVNDTNDTTRHAQKCGLTITFPTIGSTASFPLPIKGIIENPVVNKLECGWGVFEGQAGAVQLWANIRNSGWKNITYYYGTDGVGKSQTWLPLMVDGEWMTSKPINVSASIYLDPGLGAVPQGTPMKLVFEEENAKGEGDTDSLELPFIYSGENVGTMSVNVYVPNLADQPTDCGATMLVKKTVPKTTAVADASIRVLIRDSLPQLKGAYNGVTIKDKVATVDFTAAALPYLNGAACMQQATKTPIEKTLLQYPTIIEVQYSIDGKVYTLWDA
jgi:hypothetical protein